MNKKGEIIRQTDFLAIVRLQKSIVPTGRITSTKLVPLAGKTIKAKIQVIQ